MDFPPTNPTTPRWLGLCILWLAASFANFAVAQFTPPERLNATSGNIHLDRSYRADAWLVYTYDIDERGRVVNAVIQSSNGVTVVEQEVLRQLQSWQFHPATSNGKPVAMSSEPALRTWIYDEPREMSPRFADMYRRAWDLFAQEDYDAAFEIASELKNYPGRNALEEVKFQLLAASLAFRWDDGAAEMQHLARAIEFQNLALSNRFKNTYMDNAQYLQVLDRMVTLQLQRMMLADAGGTLEKMRGVDSAAAITAQAETRYREGERAFHAMPDVTVQGELVPLFRDGPGSWKTGLSRQEFSISNVQGVVNGVYLVCANGEWDLDYPAREPWRVPAGWERCKVDVSGSAGTRLVLHQQGPGQR